MKTVSASILGLALTAVPAAAQAQNAGATDTRDFAVIGSVPTLCSGGTLTGGGQTFDLGVLVNTTTGLLRTDLSASARTLVGSFCTQRSTISINATPMTAQSFTATPPAGFSRSVDYTATASGWTATPASFRTSAASNAAASQTRDTPFTGDIAVSVADFATTGGNTLRLVADTVYRGTITVVITGAN
ncbi:hypothetical protein [Tsuneonella amylolytica]|uniref:hypothetical protein n=1 Tax=Tsuneonella amylolytica TaxID=2338327 RepID=UPI000EAA8FB8|nr:hypothetical protein [Tsuneonella amylolytica]